MKSKELKLHGYKKGGRVNKESSSDYMGDRSMQDDMGKSVGSASGSMPSGRLDKYKRGGRTKKSSGKKKGGDTKITIINAPMAKEKGKQPVPVPVPTTGPSPTAPTTPRPLPRPLPQTPTTPTAGTMLADGVPAIRKCGGRVRKCGGRIR